MNNTKIVIWALASIAALAIGFMLFSPQDSGAQVTNVDGAQMQQLVADGVRIIDVRTPGEYEAGHIPGAELVPITEFAATAPAWDGSGAVAIYCATGSRSMSAVQTLEQLGFAEVYHLDAGMIVWNGEVERGQAVASAPAPAPQPTGTPVLYEFFTDW